MEQKRGNAILRGFVRRGSSVRCAYLILAALVPPTLAILPYAITIFDQPRTAVAGGELSPLVDPLARSFALQPYLTRDVVALSGAALGGLAGLCGGLALCRVALAPLRPRPQLPPELLPPVLRQSARRAQRSYRVRRVARIGAGVLFLASLTLASVAPWLPLALPENAETGAASFALTLAAALILLAALPLFSVVSFAAGLMLTPQAAYLLLAVAAAAAATAAPPAERMHSSLRFDGVGGRIPPPHKLWYA